MSPSRLERYEGVSAIPMLIASFGFIALWIVPIALALSPAVSDDVELATWVLWALFATDYVIRFVLAANKLSFAKRNIVDLLVVLLPLLAPLRLISGLRALRVLRTLTLLSVTARAQKTSRNILNPQNISVAIAIVITVAFVGAALELQFERGAPASNIKSFSDAIWWAMTTITTVGYGDKYPTTVEGKGIALFLMFVGVGTTGLLSAALATYFIGERQEKENLDIVERLERIEALLKES
jgi:voltage-gated potassium channel